MPGISIQIGTEFLDIPPGTRVRIRMESPLFNLDSIVSAAYSFPIQLNWTPTNARLLRHADRISASSLTSDIDGILWLGGLQFGACTIHFRDYKSGRYDIDLTILPIQQLRSMSGAFITDQEFGSLNLFQEYTGGDIDDYHATVDALFSDTTVLPESPVVFAPVRNTNSLGGASVFLNLGTSDPGQDYALPWGQVNSYMPGVTNPFLFYYTGTASFLFEDLMSPFPYLHFILFTLLKNFGITITGDIYDEAEFKLQVIVSNLLVNLEVQIDVSGGLGVAPVVGISNFNYQTVPIAKALPKLTVVELLIALQKRYNGCFLFRTDHSVEFKSLNAVLNSTDVKDITTLIVQQQNWELIEAGGFTLKEDAEPLDQARGSDHTFDDDSHFIGPVASVADLAGLSPSIGDYCIVTSAARIYHFDYKDKDPVAKWDDYGNADIEQPLFQPTVGDVSIDIGVSLTTMFLGSPQGFSSKTWMIPEIDEILSDPFSNDHKIGVNRTTKLRLLFYRGLQNDSDGQQYPLLTAGVQAYDGTTITDAEWEEHISSIAGKGIYELWYRRWLAVINKMRLRRENVNLGVADLLNFKWDQKLHADGSAYLCKSIDVECTADTIGIPTLELVRLP